MAMALYIFVTYIDIHPHINVYVQLLMFRFTYSLLQFVFITPHCHIPVLPKLHRGSNLLLQMCYNL